MNQKYSKPDRGSRWLQILIIGSLIAFGAVMMKSKLNIETPVKFTDRDLPPQATTMLKQAKSDLNQANLQALLRAKIIYNAMLSTAPNYPPAQGQTALVNAALSHLQGPQTMANWELAETQAQRVLESFPAQTESLLALAYVRFFRDQDAKQAQTLATKALKQDRFNVYGLALLAEIAASRNKFKLAARHADTLALQNSDAFWLRMYSCRYHSLAEQWPEAQKTCLWALQINRTDAEALRLASQAKTKTSTSKQ